MEIEILEEGKNEIKFKVKGETYTLLNLLKKELFNDENTEFVGFTVEHPLFDEAIFVLKMKKGTAKKAIKSAIERVQKQITNLQMELKKL